MSKNLGICCADKMVIGRWYKIISIPRYDDCVSCKVSYSINNKDVAFLAHDTVYIKKKGEFTITATDTNGNTNTKTIQTIEDPTPVREEVEYTPTTWNDFKTKILEFGEGKLIKIKKGTYDFNIKPEDTLNIPKGTLLDFNNSTLNIYHEGNDAYMMFNICADFSGIRNCKFIGKGMYKVYSISEQCRTIEVTRGSYGLIENIYFKDLPGFNLIVGGGESFWNTKPEWTSGRWLAENSFAGYINPDNGQLVASDQDWCMKDAVANIVTTDNSFCAGWSDGWIRSGVKIYDIAFYDDNDNFITIFENCQFFKRFYFPENSTKFRMCIHIKREAPTNTNPADDYCFVRLKSGYTVSDLMVKNIRYGNNASGGVSVVGICEDTHFDNIQIIGNGWRNAWAFDYEDGWQGMLGSVISHCLFAGTVVNHCVQGLSIISSILYSQVSLIDRTFYPTIINSYIDTAVKGETRGVVTYINSYIKNLKEDEKYKDQTALYNVGTFPAKDTFEKIQKALKTANKWWDSGILSIKTNLVNCTISNNITEIEENKPYTATITPNEKYILDTPTITMDGKDITSSSYNDGKINISKVTGNIIITISATAISKYSVINNLNNTTSTNTINEIYADETYEATLKASDGYILYTTTITMGGNDVTSTALKGNKISIANPTGDIVITASSEILGNPVFSVESISLNEGDSVNMYITLDKTPTIDQTVTLTGNFNAYNNATITPKEIVFEANQPPTNKSITITALNDSEDYCDNYSRLTAKSDKVNSKDIGISIKNLNNYDKNADTIPLDNIVFNMSPKDLVNYPKESYTDYKSYKIYDKVNNELIPQIEHRYLNPFANSENSSNLKKTKLYDIINNSNTDLSFIFGKTSSIRMLRKDSDKCFLRKTNWYGTYGWNTWGIEADKMPYINAAGESKTFSANKEFDITKINPPSYTKEWGNPITTIVLTKDGKIKFYADNILLDTFDNSADFKSWDFSWIADKYNYVFLSTYLEYYNYQTIITTDEVTVDDINNYYKWLIKNEKTQNIDTLEKLFLQVGDSAKIYSKALPAYLNKTTTLSTESSNISLSDNIVTAKAIGDADVISASDDIRKTTKVSVGKQISDECLASINNDRNITDILLVEYPKDDLYIDQEFPVYAIGIDENADLPYTVGTKNLLTYSSNNPEICSVQYGVLHARKTGVATITVSNLQKTITKNFDVNVTVEPTITIQDSEILTVNPVDYNISIDKTNAENTTKGIQKALDFAANNNYKKIIFPKGEYLVCGDYGKITFPNITEIDFSESIMYFDWGSCTEAGYTMLIMKGCDNLTLKNLTTYGEKFIKDGGNTFDCTISLLDCYRCKIINCHFWYSPGFNACLGFERTAMKGGLTLANIEVGGLDEVGENDTRTENVYRSKNMIDISTIKDNIGLGNMQGYQGYKYMNSRLYDLYFFDENKTFISKLKYCVQYQLYEKPANAKYAKVAFYQNFMPSNVDPDFSSIAHFYSLTQVKECTFKDCSFKYNVMTGMSPQGGIRLNIQNCIFEDNGFSDPYSHIDWEDGRIHIQGHILRNNQFIRKTGGRCNLAMLNGRDIAFHDNIVIGGSFYNTGEMQNARIYRNQFIGTSVSLNSKTDACYISNIHKGNFSESVDVKGMTIIKDGNTTIK